MPPPDYFIMNGCPVDCADCQLPYCPFDLGFDEDPDWDEEEDVEEGECEGVGDDAQCLGCPEWGGEGLCCLSLSQEETKKRNE